MKIETRRFRRGLLGEKKILLLIAETKEESQLIEECLGTEIPTAVVGEVRLSDGYGEHYIGLEKKC